MTIQEALMLAGQVSAIMAVLLLALAVRTYVCEDIRGVSDDLSGRRRMRGMRAARGKAAHASSHARAATAIHAAESPTLVVDVDGSEEATLVNAREAAKGAPFVVTRDVVVCPGGDL